MVAPKAIREPSGDHANESTLKSFFFVRCLPTIGPLKASETLKVQRWLKLYSLRTTSKSPRYSLRSFATGGAGSVARYAIALPSSDHAKPLMAVSDFVS